MSAKLSGEQKLLCTLLGLALNGGKLSQKERQQIAGADTGHLIKIAERHKVAPLLYDLLYDCEELGRTEREHMKDVAKRTILQSYRLLFLTRHFEELFESRGICTVVLKGSGIAALYPVPELRKAGDVDLLVRKADLEKASRLLEEEGYWVSESQHANHHLSCCSTEGIDIELHTLLAEPFNNEKTNARMEKLSENFFERRVIRESMGVALSVPTEVHQAMQLLLHMLQHFLRAGFGLKLLCDWVVFWNSQRSEEVWKEFEGLAEDCGVLDFARVVTEVCRRYLGLHAEVPAGHPNASLAEEFLCDVFAGEEFGKASEERMVIVQGTGIADYWREFHYQMKMNHPKASKCILLWPALWVITLAVFLRNNRKLNRGTARAIMRSAGQRSKLLQQMRLWDGEEGE